MKIYEGTGVLKTGELRVTRPITSLRIETDQHVEDILNEKITMFIEKANGNNVELATNISLKPYMLSSTYGESGVLTTGTDLAPISVAVCELAELGSIVLEENESIKISLTDLKSGKNYIINGIESPVKSATVIKHERKIVLTEDVSRTFNVETYDSAVIDGVANIDEAHILYNNGETVKHTSSELISIAHDVDNVAVYKNGLALPQVNDIIVFPLVGINSLQIFKSGGLITLTLKDSDVPY